MDKCEMPNKNVNESQTEEKAYWDERERKKME